MNFRWAAIATAGMILFGTNGEAGRCMSSSSSEVEVEEWSATG
jgi:hypothetical protein